ncbi:CMGC protein kinase [Cryptosporidium felis]|nr:CMGC protein kinase [Cryptosporidium felis]
MVVEADLISGVGETIKVGGYGRVQVFRENGTGRKLAYKTAKSSDENWSIEKERDLLNLIESEYVIKGYGSFPDGGGLLTIILEYFPRDLRRVIQGEECNFGSKKKILWGLLKGIADIHDKLVTHNDLKPENILVDEYFNAKICDFGMATNTEKDFIEFDKVSYCLLPIVILGDEFIK